MSGFFTSPEVFFTAPALAGTAIYALRGAFMALGSGEHGSDDAGGHGGLDVDGGVGTEGHGHADQGHSDHSLKKVPEGFRILTMQNVAAFLMGFGWGGYALVSGGGDPITGVAGGVVLGAAAAGLQAALFRGIATISGGGDSSIDHALGREAEVYVTVPAKGEGRGQVRVVIGGAQRIVTAVSNAGPLARGARVMIIGTNADNSVTVMPG